MLPERRRVFDRPSKVLQKGVIGLAKLCRPGNSRNLPWMRLPPCEPKTGHRSWLKAVLVMLGVAVLLTGLHAVCLSHRSSAPSQFTEAPKTQDTTNPASGFLNDRGAER